MKQYPITIIESWLRSQKSLSEQVLEVLELRFGTDAAQPFKSTLDAIDDVQRLKLLRDTAVRVNTVADFRQALEPTSAENFLASRKRNAAKLERLLACKD